MLMTETPSGVFFVSAQQVPVKSGVPPCKMYRFEVQMLQRDISLFRRAHPAQAGFFIAYSPAAQCAAGT
jgi:hypothetical protein